MGQQVNLGSAEKPPTRNAYQTRPTWRCCKVPWALFWTLGQYERLMIDSYNIYIYIYCIVLVLVLLLLLLVLLLLVSLLLVLLLLLSLLLWFLSVLLSSSLLYYIECIQICHNMSTFSRRLIFLVSMWPFWSTSSLPPWSFVFIATQLLGPGSSGCTRYWLFNYPFIESLVTFFPMKSGDFHSSHSKHGYCEETQTRHDFLCGARASFCCNKPNNQPDAVTTTLYSTGWWFGTWE